MAPPAQLPATMPKQSTPKFMSSRLLTMKFMQRGAAQASAEASSPSTPQTDEEGSAAKRRKISHNNSAPTTPTAASRLTQQAAKEILDEDERKRQAAIEKRAAELGDAHWVLDTASAPPPKNGSRVTLNVVHVGYAQIDYSGTVDDGLEYPGTVDVPTKARSQFNMKKSKTQKQGDDNSDSRSSSSSDEESEEGEVSEEPSRGRQQYEGNDVPRDKRARSSLSARRSEERKRAQELAGKRRKKEVKLNKLTSISGGGSQSFQRPSSSAFTCHGCGKPGHRVADCPSKKP